MIYLLAHIKKKVQNKNTSFNIAWWKTHQQNYIEITIIYENLKAHYLSKFDAGVVQNTPTCNFMNYSDL